MWVAVGELLLKRLTTPLSTINKKIRLEAYTEQSESNPGLSLGIYTAYSDSCLEDSTSPLPSIRCQSDKSVFEKKLSSERTRIERIERMK